MISKFINKIDKNDFNEQNYSFETEDFMKLKISIIEFWIEFISTWRVKYIIIKIT